MKQQQVFIEARPRRAHPYNGVGFMLISQEGLDELDRCLASREIGMQAIRVLVAMTKSLDFENQVRAGPKDLAAHLGMCLPDISRAIKTLIDLGFVLRPEWSRGPYRISPHLLWKGSAAALKKALAEAA
jgi:Firmicute plasmid replication protein (RepL)